MAQQVAAAGCSQRVSSGIVLSENSVDSEGLFFPKKIKLNNLLLGQKPVFLLEHVEISVFQDLSLSP